MQLAFRSRRLIVTAIVAFAASGFVAASSADAGVLVDSVGPCEGQALSQPFTPWADPSYYTPLGTFEGGAAGWSLSGASIGEGNEPYLVAGDNGTSSLSLPSGASATSPSMCVGLEHPTIRFFATHSGGGVLGTLATVRVDVLYENNLGALETLPIGLVTATGSWQPTLPFAVVANLLPLLPGEHTAVAFRLTAQGAGSWSVDDVFVDPWRGG